MGQVLFHVVYLLQPHNHPVGKGSIIIPSSQFTNEKTEAPGEVTYEESQLMKGGAGIQTYAISLQSPLSHHTWLPPPLAVRIVLFTYLFIVCLLTQSLLYEGHSLDCPVQLGM